jgi:hypothetical protein
MPQIRRQTPAVILFATVFGRNRREWQERRKKQRLSQDFNAFGNPDAVPGLGIMMSGEFAMPSTSIRKTDYDAATRTLSVWFVASGKRYDYENVPPETYAAFRQAFSKGRFFNAFIRNRFTYRVAKQSDAA